MSEQQAAISWDLVAHPVTQVIGEQALVDILDLSEVAWTCWGVSTPHSGLGLRMVKELDLQLALGMNERRLTPCLCMICTDEVSAVRISDRPKVEPVCSTLLGHFPSTSNISWGGL